MNRSRVDLSVSSSTRNPASRRTTITLYIAASFLFWLSLYLYLPTLPVYAQAKTDSLAVVGIILAMYGLTQGAIRLPLGIAADWLGWLKPFIIGGLILAGVGAWVMGVAPDANWLIVGRAITGLAAATWVPLVVVFSNLFRPDEVVRAVSLLNLAGCIGRVLGTGITGTLNDLAGYSLAFFLAAGIALLTIPVVVPIREERRPTQKPSLMGISHLVSRRDVLVPSLLSAVSQYVTWAAPFGFIPIIARQLGASDVLISMLTSMYLAVITLGNLLTTVIVNRVGSRRLVYASFILASSGAGMVAIVPTLMSIFAAQLCMGLAVGVGYPVLMGMSIQQVDSSERTTAMGLHQAVYSIGMFVGPALSGALAEAMGIRGMFGVTACFSITAGLFGAGWLDGPPKNQQRKYGTHT